MGKEDGERRRGLGLATRIHAKEGQREEWERGKNIRIITAGDK